MMMVFLIGALICISCCERGQASSDALRAICISFPIFWLSHWFDKSNLKSVVNTSPLCILPSFSSPSSSSFWLKSKQAQPDHFLWPHTCWWRSIFLAARRLLSHCGTRASEHVGSAVVAQGLQSTWTETPLISVNYVFTHQCLSAWMWKSMAFIKDIISLVSFMFFSSWNYIFFFFKDLLFVYFIFGVGS